MRAHEKRHLEKGLCINGDGRPISGNGSRCKECVIRQNNYRNKNIEAGLCRSGCGRNLFTKRQCYVCAGKAAAKRAGYHISEEQRSRLREITSCQICDLIFSNAPSRVDGQNIDHDHKSGKIRGVLCGNCNRMLGMAKDNIDTLKSAIVYIEKFVEKNPAAGAGTAYVEQMEKVA